MCWQPTPDSCWQSTGRTRSNSWPQQRLDRLTLVHRPVAVGHAIERQRQIEHLSWIDRSVEHQPDQLRQVTAHRGRTTEQTDVPEEQVRAVEHYAVRHADVADR